MVFLINSTSVGHRRPWSIAIIRAYQFKLYCIEYSINTLSSIRFVYSGSLCQSFVSLKEPLSTPLNRIMAARILKTSLDFRPALLKNFGTGIPANKWQIKYIYNKRLSLLRFIFSL